MRAASVLHDGSPRLAEYALDRFDPKIVIERLLAPEPTYFAHKDILFAGLTAWTVAPQYPHLVREAMILAGMSRLADLERKRQKEFPQDPFLADIVSRLNGPGIDFFQEFYYPAGGLYRAVNARSPVLMRRSFAAASKNIGFQVEMMRVCHYHAERLQSRGKFCQASFESSSDAVAKLVTKDMTPWIKSYHSDKNKETMRTINAKNCKTKAAKFIKPASLIYAASSIVVQGGTLLDILCEGNAIYADHGIYIGEWIGRAVYVEAKIISPMYHRKKYDKQNDFLPLIPALTFLMPDFGAASVIIDDAYRV